ncbi:MAG: hypothetical protein JO151_17425 [Verrucomicrobia bacterium]|nr:hypothetical protein [Verrucomicrobiota bacterium]
MQPSAAKHLLLPEGIFGLVIIALIFMVCWRTERLQQRSNPSSGRFFWTGCMLGAVSGCLFALGGFGGRYVGSINFQTAPDSFVNFVWMIIGVAISCSIPGGIMGLVAGWIWSRLRKHSN